MSLKRRSQSFLSGVHGDVAAQVAAGDEGLATVQTPELLAVGVDGHVDLQGSGLGEAFPAVDAAVAFLSRVDALVAFQVAGVREAFSTERTDERLLTCVDPHVGLQVLEARQSFTAAATDERLPAADVPAVTGRPADSVLMSPPVPSDESAVSLRQLFPHRKPWLVCRWRRPLLAVLETCRLLMLRHGLSHLLHGEREAPP